MPRDQMPWKVCATDVSGSAVEAEQGASRNSIVVAVEEDADIDEVDGDGAKQMHRVEMMREDFKRWSEAVLAISAREPADGVE